MAFEKFVNSQFTCDVLGYFSFNSFAVVVVANFVSPITAVPLIILSLDSLFFGLSCSRVDSVMTTFHAIATCMSNKNNE